MFKRALSEASEGSMSSINIDAAFQRKKQKTSATIVSDEQNKMDDWYDSSRLSRAQRTGGNIKKLKGETDDAFTKRQQHEIAKWRKRRELDSESNFATTGRWQYNEDKLERRWIKRYRQNSDLVKRTGDLSLDEAVGGTFPTYPGDREISSLYHRYWLNNDKKGFLDQVYDKYAEGGYILEKKLWEIFRCLVSELIPKKETWEGIPEYIITNPHTIWQVGKCIFNILTRGRFWDNDSNTLNPVDNGEKFGEFKVKVLQKIYSRNLIKYIVGCLSAADEARFVRRSLLDHFETVLSVYEGVYISEPEDDTADLPYEPKIKNPFIHNGLTNAEGGVYEKLLKIVKRPQEQGSDGHPTPHIFDITDLAKDYDDLTAMLYLKELNRLSVITIEGFIANLTPANRRALFGGLQDMQIARGTKGSQKPHEVLGYEFDGIDDLMPPDEKLKDIPDGQVLLKKIFEKAIKRGRKLTDLAISSLMDIAEFCQTEEVASKYAEGGHISNVGSIKQLSNVLPIVIGGSVQYTIAGRGSAANLMTADRAMALGIEFEHDSTGPILRLPISTHAIKTVGQAKVVCQFPGEPDTLKSYDFIICQNLDTPVIMGRKFLKETEVHTKHKHRLKKAMHSKPCLPYVLSITDEIDTQERLSCSINGHSLLARPDTGSVINAMSLIYALKHGHIIDNTVRKWIRLGDGSVHLTTGTTWAEVSLGDGSGPAEFVEFDIINELDVDVILGEELLLDADAFVQYAAYFSEVTTDYLDFGSIVLLGKAENAIRSLKEKFKALVKIGKTKPSVQISLCEAEELERKDNMEFHRRKREEARIKGLRGREREEAEEAERWRKERFSRHRDGIKQTPSALSRSGCSQSGASGVSASASISGNGAGMSGNAILAGQPISVSD